MSYQRDYRSGPGYGRNGGFDRAFGTQFRGRGGGFRNGSFRGNYGAQGRNVYGPSRRPAFESDRVVPYTRRGDQYVNAVQRPRFRGNFRRSGDFNQRNQGFRNGGFVAARGGGRRGGFRRGGKPKVTEERLDDDLENYWKKGGDEKAIARFEEINQQQKENKEKKTKSELDSKLDEYWSKGDAETTETPKTTPNVNAKK